jgi:RNA recognition motif-containing protein
MARNTLYVSNLAPSVDATQLGELFTEYGEVESVEFGNHRLSGDRFALVQMVLEKEATKANLGLNGYELDGHYLAVSYPEPDISRPFLSRHKKIAESVAEQLNETEKKPVRMIHAMVLLCGPSFVQAIAKEAQEIDAGEGIMTSDSSQRRTLGGVFFYLARYRMSDAVRRIIYNRKGKLPPPENESGSPDEDQ